ncbi:efflux transporter outer membrane subunit [Ramlibacter sp. MAHUQ-53]|uniref:efflux transporter outer membrane subunit n=1 Tax=unclassified Ramlibacter TaxID=2617605 RepID=UPI00362B13B7
MSRTTFRLALVAAVAALAAGCSLMPAYERPAAPVSAQWPHAAAPEGAPADALAWQRFFTDARLQALQATALRNNRDLRIALLNVAQARAQVTVREADRFPTVGAGVAGSRAPNSSGGTTTSYTAGFTVTAWEIDLFGRLASLGEAAGAQYLASEEGRRAAQSVLLAGVASTWLQLAADESLLALTRQTLATREDSLRLVKLRFDNGASSALDLRQAESLAESARAALAQQERQRAQDLNALSLLLGAPAPADAGRGVDLAALALPDLPAGVPSEVLARRPDVRQAEQLLVAANASIGAARAAFFPRISLTASLGLASKDLSDLFAGGTWAYAAAPQALLTVFDAGRNRANLRSAEAARDIAVAQYERAIQSAFREVADALAGRATFGEQQQALERQAAAEAARLRLATLRHDAGVASSLELLDAQRSLFAVQQSAIQVRLARLQNQVQLYRALGGGWVDEAGAR